MKKIIEQVQQEIAYKNLKEDLPEFKQFIFEYFEKNNYQVELREKINQKGIKGLVLKIAQKIIYKIMQPTIDEQNIIYHILGTQIKELKNEIKTLSQKKNDG